MASIMKDLRNEDTITAANENNDEKDLQEEENENNEKIINQSLYQREI